MAPLYGPAQRLMAGGQVAGAAGQELEAIAQAAQQSL